MYRRDITFSMFDHLDQSGNAVFNMVDGGEISQYTVTLVQKDNPKRLIFCMQAGIGMDLDDLIFLALQNMHFFLGFKGEVASKAHLSKEQICSIYSFEIEICFNNVTCPVYPIDSMSDVKFRYEEKAKFPFAY